MMEYPATPPPPLSHYACIRSSDGQRLKMTIHLKPKSWGISSLAMQIVLMTNIIAKKSAMDKDDDLRDTCE